MLKIDQISDVTKEEGRFSGREKMGEAKEKDKKKRWIKGVLRRRGCLPNDQIRKAHTVM